MSAALCFDVLYVMLDVFKAYFKEFNEKRMKNNFVVVYELLDEMFDFGYPQITNEEMLQLYIKSEKLKKKAKVRSGSKVASGAQCC
eukprot:SAG31_NODE_603_length_13622_cov_19.019953_1_plen_86_part_00